MAGNLLIKNANGKTVTLQNPDTNNSDVTVKMDKLVVKDASGNVGLGVTPSAWQSNIKALDISTVGGLMADPGSTILTYNCYRNTSLAWIYKTNGYATLYDQEAGYHIWSTAVSGTGGGAITFTDVMKLYNSGELVTQFTGIANSIGYRTRSSSAAGTGYYHYVGQSNGTDVIRIAGNGNVLNINNSYGALSDIKLKENIVDTTPKLDKLMQVRVVNYNLIGDEQKQIGVVAQEIEKIFPSIVEETKDTKQVEVTKTRIIPAVEEVKDEDGNIITEAKPEGIEEYTEVETQETGETTKNVKYSVIYMMMLKAMQEQQEIINDLKARIIVLENK